MHTEQAKCLSFPVRIKVFPFNNVVLDLVYSVFYALNTFSDIRLLQIPFYTGLLYIQAFVLYLTTLLRSVESVVTTNSVVVNTATLWETEMLGDRERQCYYICYEHHRSPYLSYWTRPNPLRALLITDSSKSTDYRYLKSCIAANCLRYHVTFLRSGQRPKWLLIKNTETPLPSE